MFRARTTPLGLRSTLPRPPNSDDPTSLARDLDLRKWRQSSVLRDEGAIDHRWWIGVLAAASIVTGATILILRPLPPEDVVMPAVLGALPSEPAPRVAEKSPVPPRRRPRASTSARTAATALARVAVPPPALPSEPAEPVVDAPPPAAAPRATAAPVSRPASRPAPRPTRAPTAVPEPEPTLDLTSLPGPGIEPATERPAPTAAVEPVDAASAPEIASEREPAEVAREPAERVAVEPDPEIPPGPAEPAAPEPGAPQAAPAPRPAPPDPHEAAEPPRPGTQPAATTDDPFAGS